jgi:hypothetical protein
VQCYYPYMLFSKKRYAGLMFTKPDGPDYIDVKGLQLVRRDNCPLVKEVSATILDRIMYERSKERAVEAARDAVMRVLRHEEPLAKFVVSKALRSDYKNLAQVSHGEGGGAGQGFATASLIPVTRGRAVECVLRPIEPSNLIMVLDCTIQSK